VLSGKSGTNGALLISTADKGSLKMGSKQHRPATSKARPILTEQDYQGAKELLEREMQHAHSDKIWDRLEALMQEVAEYEARFLQGEEEDASGLVEYAYAYALEEGDGPRRRWTDTAD
jgi:hypothetical protein